MSEHTVKSIVRFPGFGTSCKCEIDFHELPECDKEKIQRAVREVDHHESEYKVHALLSSNRRVRIVFTPQPRPTITISPL